MNISKGYYEGLWQRLSMQTFGTAHVRSSQTTTKKHQHYLK